MLRNRNFVHILDELKSKDGFPKLLHAELHPTDRCNLRCYYCNQVSLREGKPRELSTDLVLKTLEDMCKIGLKSLRLSGGGEPTLSPAFPKIIDFLKSHDIALSDLTTNGILLDKQLLNTMKGLRWDGVLISFSTPDEKNWKAATGGSGRHFRRIIDNVEEIIEMRHKSNSTIPLITLGIGIDELNYKDLSKSYEFAYNLGVNALLLKSYNSIEYSESIRSAGEMIVDQIREMVEENKSRKNPLLLIFSVSSLGLNEIVQGLFVGDVAEENAMLSDDSSEPCFMPWYGTLIQANGNVLVCCSGSDLLFPVMGNIHEESIVEIWRGRSYAELRSKFEEAFRASLNGRKGQQIPTRCQPDVPPDIGCPIKVCANRLLEYY